MARARASSRWPPDLSRRRAQRNVKPDQGRYPLQRMVRRHLHRSPGRPSGGGLARVWLVGWVALGIAVALGYTGAVGAVVPARPVVLRQRSCCHPRRNVVWLGKPLRLVDGRLPGGYFSIFGERYRRRGETHIYTQLSYRFETFRGHVVKSGGSVDTGYDEPGSALVLEAANGHLQRHRYATVYGLLRKPHDIVTARISGQQIAVRRVALPALLHTRDVLIYLTVMEHARATRVTVTAHTATGKIDSRKDYNT